MNILYRFLIIAFLLVLGSCKKAETDEAKPLVGKTIYGCAPAITDAEWFKSNKVAPLFKGMEVLHYPVTTTDKKVQRYFNQGLALAYGFNHNEAARSFYYAAKLDPNCAMAYWGYAYVLGPNYNAGMDPDNYQKAYDAIQKAIKLADKVTPKEKDLITALAKRYTAKPVDDRKPLDLAYSKAMQRLTDKYPEDLDIATLYVESVMDMHPWDLYDKSGKPKEWTPEIESLLNKILTKNPRHIGANHFYIHAVESSDTPERGNTAAKLFDEGLFADSGHLVHMSSHIYIRTGEYHKGTLANINAVKIDSAYVTLCHAQGAYPLAYYPHNYHFLAATATLEGNYHWAKLGAAQTAKLVHPQNMIQPGLGTLQHYYVIPYFVAVKFGKWEDILKMKLVSDTLTYPSAVAHYAKGMAFLGKKNINNAKKELATLEKLTQNPMMKQMTIWEINSMADILQIAVHVLRGEILASEKKYNESITELKAAVVIEDKLNYNEPPDWFFSVRHHLGAVQMEAGKYKEAIVTYQEDLKQLKNNGWAQHGLLFAYQKLNDLKKVKETQTLLTKSWATADIKIETSRIK
ncbi:hypothetical protein [Flavobacterium rivulicola]|uniref:hypothetical protein n=1 Tax=Flavobacterium rivulicola TaxID=2732161 RepID=UPI00197FF37D|nr:hypothetical protein [Flavobacterium sp. IMCC34852]